ncbi:amidase family protein [Aquimarina litoralis]|uniref:amidase family protein n=1 Tax=Aquimarina litoralis TaxID=584605 RepID=UPI001C56AE06|nr:amidase family protein [Aquimarina litoralis]MBW1295526.1 amidase [Aquimarina litoralis]
MIYRAVLIFILIFSSCKKEITQEVATKQPTVVWQSYDESEDLKATLELEQPRMHLKLINSKVLDKNQIWEVVESELNYFSEEDYNAVKPLILEKDIPSLQNSIKQGMLTYEKLVLFYLYRIRKYESDNKLSLNGIISLNPEVVKQARELDKIDTAKIDIYSIYGMPILLKDNINAEGMATTAGAVVLQNNMAKNAFITDRLVKKKALILGKANLSEWAYFFCSGCPVGYSAIGGQTLNPYGRMIFESGGSSSGSGVTVAANFCVAAIGTETSGSILSPSSQNAVVGLKPTVGVFSRSGIVPISSTLDTPGPMTKSVIDNVILYNVLIGQDAKDIASVPSLRIPYPKIMKSDLKGKKFGVLKEYLKDSLYANAVENIRSSGAEIFELEPKTTRLPGFLTILNVDMKHDLPRYLASHTNDDVTTRSIEDIIAFNLQDSLVRMPYGQALLEGVVIDSTTVKELDKIKGDLQTISRNYFDIHLDAHDLDAILSINNYHAGYAAVAKYPAITVPMGYTDKGEPKGLTFIAKSFSETKLLELAFAYEQVSKKRQAPSNYN